MEFIPLTSKSQLDDIDFRSRVRKQVLFKHSTRCHISLVVLKQVKAELSGVKESFDIYYLDLLKHRDVSNEISQRYKVKHESPQLLVIENAKCVFDTSHDGISLNAAGLI